MRCSRVGGVILYSFDNGHFMAYTSPPPTAEPLLKEKPFGECICQLSTPAMPDYRAQPPPRGSGQRSWTQGWRSQTEGEIFKGTDGACADPGTQNFPCHGGLFTGPAFQFYSSSFHVTRSLLCFFLGLQERIVPLRPFVPPSLRPSPSHAKSPSHREGLCLWR